MAERKESHHLDISVDGVVAVIDTLRIGGHGAVVALTVE